MFQCSTVQVRTVTVTASSPSSSKTILWQSDGRAKLVSIIVQTGASAVANSLAKAILYCYLTKCGMVTGLQ